MCREGPVLLNASLFHYYKSKCRNCSWVYVTIPKDVYLVINLIGHFSEQFQSSFVPCGHALVVLEELEEDWFESWECGVLKAELHIALPGLCVNH